MIDLSSKINNVCVDFEKSYMRMHKKLSIWSEEIDKKIVDSENREKKVCYTS